MIYTYFEIVAADTHKLDVQPFPIIISFKLSSPYILQITSPNIFFKSAIPMYFSNQPSKYLFQITLPIYIFQITPPNIFFKLPLPISLSNYPSQYIFQIYPSKYFFFKEPLPIYFSCYYNYIFSILGVSKKSNKSDLIKKL